MAILLDSFSYRVKKLSGGVYLDRWDGNTFPEFILPDWLSGGDGGGQICWK